MLFLDVNWHYKKGSLFEPPNCDVSTQSTKQKKPRLPLKAECGLSSLPVGVELRPRHPNAMLKLTVMELLQVEGPAQIHLGSSRGKHLNLHISDDDLGVDNVWTKVMI